MGIERDWLEFVLELEVVFVYVKEMFVIRIMIDNEVEIVLFEVGI